MLAEVVARSKSRRNSRRAKLPSCHRARERAHHEECPASMHDKAVQIRLGDVSSPAMRAFHVTWSSFFLCFFGWFGIAPLMAVVRDEFGLTKAQVGNTVIASVAITIVARLFVGWLCDRVGPRLAYTGLLLLGSLPVMGIGLAHDYTTFLVCRLLIGAIGASFVITQYHTSQMFAPNCVGTANATTAGWGNLGGGITQMAMPALFAAAVGLGASEHAAWRLAMLVPGLLMVAMGVVYYRATVDTPRGNFAELRARGEQAGAGKRAGGFAIAARDRRVWVLFCAYAACFGVELTVNNVGALYFHDTFQLGMAGAGVVAGLHGAMNLFARTLGGFVSDRVARLRGLRGRALVLSLALLCEGLLLFGFARAGALPSAIGFYLAFSLFVSASCGATYAVVPMLDKRALGSIAGIVGAGGNAGAVLAGFLFRAESLRAASAFGYLATAVVASAVLALTLRFSADEERNAQAEMERSLEARRALTGGGAEPAAAVPASAN
jgi:NNP family nitrate/nitrite transporter-like MFS transporter